MVSGKKYYFVEFARAVNEIELFFINYKVGKIVQIIGKCTLEIYLVQYIIIYYLKSLIFPINLLLICISIIGVVKIVHSISYYMYIKTLEKFLL